jgi:hypothetical protein
MPRPAMAPALPWQRLPEDVAHLGANVIPVREATGSNPRQGLEVSNCCSDLMSGRRRGRTA